MAAEKVSENLARELREGLQDELVELIVELEPAASPADEGLSRGERIAARKAAFDRELEPVESQIQRAGGEIVDRVWLNQTVKVRLPRAAVGAVSGLAKVRRLDVGRRVEPDFG